MPSHKLCGLLLALLVVRGTPRQQPAEAEVVSTPAATADNQTPLVMDMATIVLGQLKATEEPLQESGNSTAVTAQHHKGGNNNKWNHHNYYNPGPAQPCQCPAGPRGPPGPTPTMAHFTASLKFAPLGNVGIPGEPQEYGIATSLPCPDGMSVVSCGCRAEYSRLVLLSVSPIRQDEAKYGGCVCMYLNIGSVAVTSKIVISMACA